MLFILTISRYRQADSAQEDQGLAEEKVGGMNNLPPAATD